MSQPKNAPKPTKELKANILLRKQLKAWEIRARLAELKGRLASGQQQDQIMEAMGLTLSHFNELKRDLYRNETTALYSQTTEEVYLDYAWKQTRCVQDLDEMIVNFKATKQYNAMVGAVRAKSDIIDKLIKVGQDMGVLERAPERKMVLHGHVIANLDNNNLRQLVVKEIQGLASIVRKYGDNDILGPQQLPPPAAPEPAAAEEPEVLPPPQFSDNGRPYQATGGRAKSAGARAIRPNRRVQRQKMSAPPPPFSG